MTEKPENQRLDTRVATAVSHLLGKSCCRQRVGRGRSISIGFGDKRFHGKPNMPDDFYGEWEIGTYYAAWRIVQGSKILCGSQNVVDSIAELDQMLNSIRLGAVSSVCLTGHFDVFVELDNDLRIEFLGTFSDDDEVFHIFGPNNAYLEYTIEGGWVFGRSDTPWE